MQYMLLIHDNTKSASLIAGVGGVLRGRRKQRHFKKGGSTMGKKQLIGASASSISSEHIGGFMQFDSDDKQRVLDLLDQHPVIRHGGTIELCEMPIS